MTSPLATASTNLYTVTFDGYTIYVYGRHFQRSRPLRTIPLGALLGFEVTPGSSKGILRFDVNGKRVAADRLAFTAQQRLAVETLVAAIRTYHQPRLVAAADPWHANPVAPNQRVVVMPHDPRGTKLMNRALTLSIWLEGISLVILLAPIVLGILACAGAFFLW